MVVATEQMITAFLPFRVATATTTVACSTMLATPASGGVLRSPIVATPTTGTCTTIPQVSTGTATISRAASLSVASGIIDLFGYLQWAFSAHCII